MLGVEGYGSDSDSDGEDQQTPVLPPPKPATSTKPTTSKLGLSLPPPTAGSSKSSGLSLPPPKKRGPKKIAIGLPSLPDAHKNDELDDQPPAKKPRLEMRAGAGASALLGMLPAPKNKNPVPEPKERVLGAGRGQGLVFNTGSRKPIQSATVEDADDAEDDDAAPNLPPVSSSILEEVTEIKEAAPSKALSLPFLPSSVARGKANISTEDRPSLPKSATVKAAAPAIDFFSLGTSVVYRMLSEAHRLHA